MSKRQTRNGGGDEPMSSAIKKARIATGIASTPENSLAPTGLKTTLHGNVFQLKLLMLFLVRGINAGFQFRLGTEIPGMGGKFDDLIFKFKKSDAEESYRFLQAKHKQNEQTEKITAADLLKDNDGDFSLPKYFRSYYRDVIKQTEGILPESIQDCIICTNIGFDRDEELRKGGIGLIRLDDHDNILSFDQVSDKKTPARYRLKNTGELGRTMRGWSDVHLLARTLLDYVTDQKQLALSSPVFKRYHVALVAEKVIDKREGKLCATFVEGDNSRFREILSELTFVHYWANLSFKSENKGTNQVDGAKELTLFEGISIEKHLPKYSTTMELNFLVFEDYYKDLVTEKVIDPEWRTKTKKPFTKEFIQGIDVTQRGLQFRKKLSNAVFIHYWKDLTVQLSKSFGKNGTADGNNSLRDLVGEKEIDDFLDRLVFAVDTPNEVELDAILKSEVAKYYRLHENDLQSDFILRKMLDWFKEKESKFMSSEEGKRIFEEGKNKLESLRVTAISIDYQKQLKEALGFNENAAEEMKEKLEQLLSADNRVGRIATPLPKRTAVKVIAALEKLRLSNTNDAKLQKYFQYEDSYLVTSSSRLQKNSSKFKGTLTSEHRCHNLLVVVYEDGTSIEIEERFSKILLCEDGTSIEIEEEFSKILLEQNKRMIILSQDVAAATEDKLKFGDLSEKSKRDLLQKEIAFQGTLQSVGDLIKRGDATLDHLIENGDPEEVIDFNSIEELLTETGNITIRTCSSARFEQELYVERQMEFPWGNSLYDKLAARMKCTTDELRKECVVDSQGNVEWFADGLRKEMIWEEMKTIVNAKRRNSRDFRLSDGLVISEASLINRENKKVRMFIISDSAGTGKSTILSNYYELIKSDKPDIWVIRIDLVDYSKELAEFNSSPGANAVEFFADIFAKNSPFARSLLRHRFQTDGRIVVMLDGFDEIDGKLHDKALHLINAITLTKLYALYVTTRPHLVEKLQDEFFQFSYTFKNFSQEDQVDCLSKYWGSKLKMSQATDGPIRLFGKSLVERLTTTLNDRERDFIGIPLQCRVLAECFESQLQDTIQQGLPMATLIENISKNDLDLTSLYSLLMEKKLEIYRQEKFKADPHHYQANWIIENTMKNLEKYLRKLAIKTIVFYAMDVDVLLGQSNSILSNQEICQEEEDFTSGGVYFGFLDKNDKGEVKFVHRTYAEFLLAKYFYGGFLPEKEINCIKHLTSEAAQEIIFKKLLIDEDYGGVRVFFNSMVKDCVPMAHLSREIEKSSRIFDVAISDKNANIFMFMCDCLDLSLQKVNIRRILSANVFPSSFNTFFYSLGYSMYKQNSKVFERFISYYDEEADQSEVQRILREMLYEPLFCLKGSQLNEEGKKKIVERVLDFLSREKACRQISDPKFKNEVRHILKVFICNTYYNSLLEKVLVLLSSAYSDDTLFENCLTDTFEDHCSAIPDGNLDKILTTLSDLGREEVLKRISRQILKMDIQLFKRFYQRREEDESTEGILSPANIQSLLARDSHRMTPLHRAALHDDDTTFNRILETIRISCSSNEEESKHRGTVVLHNVIASDEEGVTPFYVAAACESENLCKQIFKFLKEMLSEDELRKRLSEPNGVLGNALRDAMKWKKVKMLRIILESVQKFLGQDYLIALMKDENQRYNGGNVFSACRERILLKIVLKVIVDGENGFRHLFDLLFQNWKSVEHAKRIDRDTFQIMLSVNGLDAFMKRILDTDLRNGIDFVVCKIHDKFTTEQRVQLLQIFLSMDSDRESYFGRWFDFKRSVSRDHLNDYESFKKILQCVSDNLGQSVMEELLVRNDYEVFIKALLLPDKNLVDVMLTFLSSKKDEITQHLVKIMPRVIMVLEVTVEEGQQEEKIDRFWISNILNFVFHWVESCDLSNLVDLISNKRIYDDALKRKRSIWSVYLNDNRNDNPADNVPEKTDKFLKCVLDKLGQSAVEKLVVEHEYGQIITQVLVREDGDRLVDALLRSLSKEKREEIELKVMKNAPETIKNLIDKRLGQALTYWKNILHLQYVVNYADRDGLSELIEIITQSHKSHPDVNTNCVWSHYLLGKCNRDLRSQSVDKFLQCVANLLSKSQIKDLIQHKCNNGVAIIRQVAKRKKSRGLVQVMLAHLTEKDRGKVWRHTDAQVSDETSRTLQDPMRIRLRIRHSSDEENE